MPKQPLAEVFGFPINNLTPLARYYRENRLCPYNNGVSHCTKDTPIDPPGVCSIYEGEHPVIICPVRFRQDWIIADDAASFFFPCGRRWTSLTEVCLEDKHGRSAGNIDVVLVTFDERGQVIDFGALEVQAVCVSGNVRRPFEYYMEDPERHYDMQWTGQLDSPRPDYLPSLQQRLAPQLIYRGRILNNWRKKTAIAVDRSFFASLLPLSEVNSDDAEIAWLVYGLVLDPEQNRYKLIEHQPIHTAFSSATDSLTKAEVGPVGDFISRLDAALEEVVVNND
jgi:hypothetical protein